MNTTGLAKGVFNWALERFSEAPLTLTLGEVIEEFNTCHAQIPEDEVDSASRVAIALGAIIDEYVLACNRISKTPFIHRLPSDNERLISGVRELAGDMPLEKHRKKLLSATSNVLTSLHGLSPQDFEVFVCKMLEKAGLPSEQTALSRDRGVDFHGTTRLAVSNTLRDTKYAVVTFSFIGQVKRYSPDFQVGPEKFRELAGALLQRMQGIHVVSPYLGVCTPYFTVFVTTSRVSYKVWIEVMKRGCIVLDGQLLTELMIDTYLCSSSDAGSSEITFESMLRWYGV